MNPSRPAVRPCDRRLMLALLLIVPALLLLLDRLFPPPLPNPQDTAATVVLARDGTPLRAFAGPDGVWRYPVTPDDVSPLYLEALLAYEDRRFHHHAGVDALALLRATAQALIHGETISGGSTLTMQVARMLEPIPHTLPGKLRQMVRAVQIEARLSKHEILTLYLDYAPFGGTLQGVQAASYAYLGRPANELSHAEAALLAVLPQAPSRLRPDRHPHAARTARDKVLQRLEQQGAWDADIVAQAQQENVVARALRPPLHAALLAQRLREEHPRSRRIQTGIDADLQQRLEQRIEDWAARLPPRTSAAAIVIDPRDMQVRAYAGAARFGDEASFGHIDMARAFRSPGSTLKPFLYGMALDAGLIHSASLLADAPQEFGNYRPGNFDQRFRGPVSAAEALRQSLNLPAVALLDHLGPAQFAARMRHAGVPLRLPHGTEPNLSMILGGTEARLEDLAGAYAAFQRDGLAATPRLTTDEPLRERRLMSPGSAHIVRRMLQDAGRPGEENERIDTSSRAAFAWKTGTSYGFRDAWALGAAPGAIIGVWVGRPDGTSLPGQYGAITALPLLFSLGDALPRDMIAAPQRPMPPSVSESTICWPLGKRAEDTQAEHCTRRLDALLLDNTAPPTLGAANLPPPAPIAYRRDRKSSLRLAGNCTGKHEEELASLAPWPALLHPWLNASERQRATLPRLSPDCDAPSEPLPTLRIAGLPDGALIRSPSNRTEPPRISLRALGAADTVNWLLDGRLIGNSVGDAPVLLEFTQPGKQRLVAIDAQGRYGEIELRVAW